MVDEGAEHIGSRDDFKETMIFLQDWKSADMFMERDTDTTLDRRRGSGRQQLSAHQLGDLPGKSLNPARILRGQVAKECLSGVRSAFGVKWSVNRNEDDLVTASFLERSNADCG